MLDYPLIIIDPSTRYPEVEVCEQIQTLSKLSSFVFRPALNSNLRHTALGLEDLELLRFKKIAGLMILGSGASPVEQLDWQDRLKTWLTKSNGPLDQACPILGICYGHQLLAHLMGGKVEFLWNGECEKGLRSISFNDETLSVTANKAIELAVSHREGLVSLPNNWISLTHSHLISRLSSDHQVICYEMIRHSLHSWWGIQAHIDATPQFMINNQIETPLPQPYWGKNMIEAFLKLCEQKLDHIISST